MAASIYTDKNIKPDDKMLSCDLGHSISYLERIGDFIESEYGNYTREWKFYNIQSGWLLKMLSKKRNILFVVPDFQFFRVAFTFGNKAIEAMIPANFPDVVTTKISSSKKYAEGRTIQLDVKSEGDLEIILKLIKLKLSN